MKITALIAQHIKDVHEGNNWTEVNLAGTLKGVTVQEATTLTKASPNTIASLLHHITFWNRVMIQRMQGINVFVDEHNGYNVPVLQTDEDWIQLQIDNILSAHELAAAMVVFNESKLFTPLTEGGTSAYKNFQGSVEHIHYHLGQIVMLKKLIKAEADKENL